ncbi:MAG: SDR family NAD(P)-dependent oxidoreductase, partial [Gemmatimonadota bacterium]|nr:SDR family NAD(P)-dependent oxidoreductase [Gemmatimonadota bacterium]
MNRIEGMTAIITGATAGIGQACAQSLAERGVHLVLTGRRADRLAALASALSNEGVPVYTQTLDVRDRPAIQRFVGWMEAEGIVPDILVNNAGLARGLDTVQSGSHEDWDEMIDTNVKGVL